MKGVIADCLTELIQTNHPPVFDFVDTDPNRLTMKYSSQRNLQAIWLGYVRGVGVAFKEKLSIKPLDRNSIEIISAKGIKGMDCLVCVACRAADQAVSEGVRRTHSEWT
jgi:hypothetical protein